MAMSRRQTTDRGWWWIGCSMASALVLIASSCAKGSQIQGGEGGAGGAGSPGVGGAGPAAGPAGPAQSSVSATSGVGGAASSSVASGPSSVQAASSTVAAASSSSGVGCAFQEHLCNGVCAGNTVDTGCYLSATCTPCAMPSNGTALCTGSGACDISCNMGYQPNATKTDCDPIPPPMTCCDDSECPIFTICLDGYCKNPLGAVCDPVRCNDFCKCAVGGTPNSTGMCTLNGPFQQCTCTP